MASGSTGWVVAGLLGLVLMGKCVGEAPSSETAVSLASAPEPRPIRTAYVQSRTLNCRVSGAASAEIVERFTRNDSVSVLEDADDWSRLDRSTDCWVASRYLGADRAYDPPAPVQRFAATPERRSYSFASSGAFANCSAARAAGAAPVRIGEPGYSRRLDRDGDGVGCE